jgi:integrase
MPTIKLTEKSVTRLKAPDPSGKQVLHWDAHLRGFAVLCSGVTNAKTYVVQRAVNGVTRRVTVAATNVLSLSEARHRAEIVLGQFASGIDPKAARRAAITLGETLESYLVSQKPLRQRSRIEYRECVERHLSRWIDLPLHQITADMVTSRHAGIQKEIEARGVKGQNGHATANSAMRAFRVLYNFAAESTPNLPPNPVKRLKRRWFNVPRRERMVGFDELPSFYAAVSALPNPIQRDYILLLLFTGLRRREAAGLRWDDVDFKAKVIRIPAISTKANRKLDLPMSDFVHDLLVARRSIGNAKWVFPANGKSGHIEEPKFPFQLIAKATGIEVSAHDMRRTFITVAESTEMSMLALKALVNHAIGKDVTAGYVQMTVERLRGPAQKVCDEVKRLCCIAPVSGANVAELRRR